MMRNFSPVVAFLCFHLLALAQSQQPFPTPTKTTNKDESKTNPNQAETKPDQKSGQINSSNTGEPPLVVTPRDKADDTNHGKEKPAIDWWSIGNTGLNTIFTGCLVWLMRLQYLAMRSQAEYMKDALTETQKAANAAATSANLAVRQTELMEKQTVIAAQSIEASGKSAEAAEASAQTSKLSADSITRVERAWLIVQAEDLAGSEMIAQYTIRNCGKTPAWMMSISCDYKKCYVAISSPIDYSTLPTTTVNTGWTVPPQQPEPCLFNRKLEGVGLITDLEIKQAREGTLFLIFMGIIKYEDIFGVERQTRFCVNFIPDYGWALHGPPESNRRT